MNQSAPAPELSALKGEIRIVEPDRIGRSIARRSAEVSATVPDLELACDADAERGAGARARERRVPLTGRARPGVRARLARPPQANAAYRDGHYELYSRVNVGVTSTPTDAQVTPACSTPTPSRSSSCRGARARSASGRWPAS